MTKKHAQLHEDVLQDAPRAITPIQKYRITANNGQTTIIDAATEEELRLQCVEFLTPIGLSYPLGLREDGIQIIGGDVA